MNRMLLLQGEVKFLIGGKLALPTKSTSFLLIRCNSETDGYSPDERRKTKAFLCLILPEVFRAFLFRREI